MTLTGGYHRLTKDQDGSSKDFTCDPKSKGAPDDKNFRIYKNDLIL